ncbi:MAG TPA: hypothetical protein VF748_07465 [Candidatus Acidoferrum sp.]
MDADQITFWVIYFNPSDCPDKYVVRAHYLTSEGPTVSKYASVFDTLEEARAFVPPGCINLHRLENDDPVIVEAWIQ